MVSFTKSDEDLTTKDTHKFCTIDSTTTHQDWNKRTPFYNSNMYGSQNNPFSVTPRMMYLYCSFQMFIFVQILSLGGHLFQFSKHISLICMKQSFVNDFFCIFKSSMHYGIQMTGHSWYITFQQKWFSTIHIPVNILDYFIIFWNKEVYVLQGPPVIYKSEIAEIVLSKKAGGIRERGRFTAYFGVIVLYTKCL